MNPLTKPIPRKKKTAIVDLMDTDLSDDNVHSNPWSKLYLPSNSFDNEGETKLVTYKTTAEETAFLQSILDKEENNQKEQASDNMDEKFN
jgi:hypothetical protein